MSEPIRKDPVSGRYIVVVDVSKPGEKRHQLKRRFDTYRDARSWLSETRTARDKGTFVAPDRVTLGEFVEERWLPAMRGQLRPSTHTSYARNLRLHVLPELGDVRLQNLDPARLQKLYTTLAASGRRDHRTGQGLSTKSVRYVHTILRSALQAAVDWDVLLRNPADRAKPPRASASADGSTVMKTWTRTQVGSFLTAESGRRPHPLWLFLATTGVRRGEALGLGWQYLDLDAGRAQIVRTLVDRVGVEPVWSDPKTSSGRRSIELDGGTVAALRSLRVAQAQERLMFGSSYRDHDLVFCEADGRPYHPDRVYRTFQARSKAAGLPVIRLHDLRHTWATLALEALVPAKVVSERLGHANISITLNVYSHVSPAMQSNAAERVAGLIFGDPA